MSDVRQEAERLREMLKARRPNYGAPCAEYVTRPENEYGFGSCKTCGWSEPEHVIDQLAALLASQQEEHARLTADRDELNTLRKIAKSDSVEDVLAYPHESEMAVRLRLFTAIATLRVELAANKGHGALVQKVCDQAAVNLHRAEAAESALAAARAEVERLKTHLREIADTDCQVRQDLL